MVSGQFIYHTGHILRYFNFIYDDESFYDYKEDQDLTMFWVDTDELLPAYDAYLLGVF